ncbi:MAG: 3-isopropylmalate dehydrogenase [bacterium]
MYTFAVIPGDGVGEEVVREGLKVLDCAASRFEFRYELVRYPFGADHYLATGETMPESVFDEVRQMNAVYLGAIGDPRIEVGFLERAIIAGLRFRLDLFVNLRPIKLYAAHLTPLKDKGPEHIDFVVVRENTEDLYTGLGGIFKKGTPDEVAIGEMIFTRKGVERVIRYAFELARARAASRGDGPKKGMGAKLTLVDKANAIRIMDIWTRTFEEVGSEYPDVERDHNYVDACTMWMVKNPEVYDTVVVPNLFGDIITDLGAMLQGGMGIAASGNIHPGRVSMFEPIHGSAPKYRGKNVANPLAAIAAVQMMLDYVGETAASCAIEDAIASLLSSGKIPSLAAGVLKTSEIGDLVVKELSA